MSMDVRLQVLIDADRHERLLAAAADRGVSVATVVREAIDRAVPSDADERRAAGLRLLGLEPMAAPGVGDLLDELDELRGRRA